jgi:predicted lipoprotein with Yx(FWY)xxD motif
LEISRRRRLDAHGRELSEEIISLVVSYELDETAYDKLVATGVNPGDVGFKDLLALELGLSPELIVLNEYLPGMYAVEILVTDTFNAIYEAVLEVIETVTEVVDDVITSKSATLGQDALKKQTQDQCPPTKTCSYRGTCNSTTGVCDCIEGFTGALCSTIDDSVEFNPTTILRDGTVRIKVVNATTDFENSGVGGALVSEERFVYYFFQDFVDVDNEECPQPTYTGSDWPLVFAKDIGKTGGGSCTLQNYNMTSDTYVCCFVRGYGLMPVYQYIGDTSPDDYNGEGAGDQWFRMDSDGNSIQNTETRSPTTSPTNAPTPAQAPTTDAPTSSPVTNSPTNSPVTGSPSTSPTTSPTNSPTTSPTNAPTNSPTTAIPTTSPTSRPTNSPTPPTRAPVAVPKSPSTGGNNDAGLLVIIITLMVPLAIAVIYSVGEKILGVRPNDRVNLNIVGGYRGLPRRIHF